VYQLGKEFQMTQTHSKFKVFITEPGSNGLINDDVPLAVSRFVDQHGVNAKSIGVEFVEGSGKVILSLGYAEGQGTAPVTVKTVGLGKLGLDASAIEAALEKSASLISNVICHEFYVDAKGDTVAVFLAHT
jgi:hypothetical protein